MPASDAVSMAPQAKTTSDKSDKNNSYALVLGLTSSSTPEETSETLASAETSSSIARLTLDEHDMHVRDYYAKCAYVRTFPKDKQASVREQLGLAQLKARLFAEQAEALSHHNPINLDDYRRITPDETAPEITIGLLPTV